jgi:heme/copper-type cytochrome/quinol oxidase subunit 2
LVSKIKENSNYLADYQKNSWLLENKKSLRCRGVFRFNFALIINMPLCVTAKRRKMQKLRASTIVFTVALVCLVSLMSVIKVNALNQDEWSATVSWSSHGYYQGDSGSVTVNFDSSCPEELKIRYIGVNFDWMPSDGYYPLDLSDNPVGIASDGQYTFNSIGFNIPSDASVGQHSVKILIKGQQHGLWWYDISVTASTSVTVHDAYELIYNQLYPQTSSKMSNAQNVDYKSPDAQSLMQQANSEINVASSLANQGQWHDAVTHLQSVSNLIDQADAKEQSYQEQQETESTQQTQSNILIIVAIVIAVAVVGGVVGYAMRKKQNPQNN